MTGILLLASGLLVYLIALVLLFRDSVRGYGTTMGGDMLSGGLRLVGCALAAPGACLVARAPLWLSLPAAVILVLIGFPLRSAVDRIGARHGRPAPPHQLSGFAEHVRRTEKQQAGGTKAGEAPPETTCPERRGSKPGR